MSAKKLLLKLERALNEKLPKDLQTIILHTAFETESSIRGINSEVIAEIEKYINVNKNILEGTSYRDCLDKEIDFKFKPGHKSILLSLPRALIAYNDNLKKKKSQTNKKPESQNKKISETEVKDALIKKLNNFATNQSYDVIFEGTLVENLGFDKNKWNCKIRCPMCREPSKCTYESYWMVSNFQKHLKKHFKTVVVVMEPADEADCIGEIISYENDEDIYSE